MLWTKNSASLALNADLAHTLLASGHHYLSLSTHNRLVGQRNGL